MSEDNGALLTRPQTELDKASLALGVAVGVLQTRIWGAQHNDNEIAKRAAREQLLAGTKEVNRWMVQIQNHVALLVQS